MTLKDLEVAFEFTEEDLFANREGKFSAGQVRRVRRWLNTMSGITGGGVLVALGLSLLAPGVAGLSQTLSLLSLILVATLSYRPLKTLFGVKRLGALYALLAIASTFGLAIHTAATMNLLILLGYIVMVTTIPAMAGLAVLTRFRPLHLELKTVTGRISLKTGDQNMMRIGEQQFVITNDQLLALRDKREYTVYYEPITQKIGSIEPVEEDDPLRVERLALMPEKMKNDDEELVLGDDGELVLQHKSTRS